MFTLEQLTELRQTGEKRLRWLAVLGGVLAFTLLLSAAVLDRWAPRSNQRLQAVAALNAETRALIVGSSHVFASINPALLQPPSMNLAAPVCSYVCVEGIVQGNLERAPGVAALVIEYDVVPAFYDTLSAYRGDYRALLELSPDIGRMAISSWQKYELWRDRALEQSILGPLFRFEKLNPEQLLRHLRHGPIREDEVVGPGFANGNDSALSSDGGLARAQRHVRETPGLSAFPENAAALRRLVQLGLSRGWKLALVRLPHHPSYWAALPPVWQQTLAQLLGQLQNEFPSGFVYWDLGTSSELSDSDFRNGDHVTARAATRVTAIFQQHLQQLLAGAGEAAAVH